VIRASVRAASNGPANTPWVDIYNDHIGPLDYRTRTGHIQVRVFNGFVLLRGRLILRMVAPYEARHVFTLPPEIPKPTSTFSDVYPIEISSIEYGEKEIFAPMTLSIWMATGQVDLRCRRCGERADGRHAGALYPAVSLNGVMYPVD